MRRLLTSMAFFVVLATIALFIFRSAQPGRHELELDVYVLLVGALAVFTVVLITREAFPPSAGSAIAAALEVEPQEPVRPPDLERTERLLTLSSSTAYDFHFRLRPILRDVAEQRLADRRGLRLDAGGPEVEEALGEELWELVRPDRESPKERFAPDVDRETLERVVERLESIQ
jgi:hypothetical protein